jgi:hypothetical protein
MWVPYLGIIGVCAGTIWILIVVSNRQPRRPFWTPIFSPLGTGQLAGGIVLLLWQGQARPVWVKTVGIIMVGTVAMDILGRHWRRAKQRRSV